jgi:hypothetical protein
VVVTNARPGRRFPAARGSRGTAPPVHLLFGGDNGRTGYTIADAEAAGARNLCVLVADELQQVVPDSGNCAPIAHIFDTTTLTEQVNRLYGNFIGTCSLGATLIVPDGWRWFDLSNQPLPEIAASLLPTQSDEMLSILERVVDLGGVIWAEGQVVDDFIVNLNVAIVEADVSTASTSAEVASALAQRGVDTTGATDRSIAGRPVLTQAIDQGASTSVTLLPDFGYVIALTLAQPESSFSQDNGAIGRRCSAADTPQCGASPCAAQSGGTHHSAGRPATSGAPHSPRWLPAPRAPT